MCESENRGIAGWVEDNELSTLLSYFPCPDSLGSHFAWDIVLWTSPECQNLPMLEERRLHAWMSENCKGLLFRGPVSWQKAIPCFLSVFDEILCRKKIDQHSDYVKGSLNHLFGPCFNSDPQKLLECLSASAQSLRSERLKTLVVELVTDFESVLSFGDQIPMPQEED
jgi:hypothetical protein